MTSDWKWCHWRDIPASLQDRIKKFFLDHPEWDFWGSIESTVYDHNNGRSSRLMEMARHYDRCELYEAMKALNGDEAMKAELEQRDATAKELREIAIALRKVEELVPSLT